MSDKMTSLTDLLEMVKAAEGPSREIDAKIVAELHNAIVKPYPPTDDYGPKNRWQFWSRDGEHFLANESKWDVPPLSSSIDAALELVEKEIPRAANFKLFSFVGHGMGWSGEAWAFNFSDRDQLNEKKQFKVFSSTHNRTIPLAILCALISAKIEETG